MDIYKLNCGDQVYLKHDMRHVGRVVAINHERTARVQWSSLVVSDEREVVKVPRVLACKCCTGGCMCEKHSNVGRAVTCEFHVIHPDE